jgi:bacteriocin-like protein
MNTLTENELQKVEGGATGIPILGAYVALLDKMERNPNSYTWMMDWYYR